MRLKEENAHRYSGKFFTSVQVLFGTMIGGFFSGIYMIAKNYESFGEIQNKKKTFLFGIIGFILIWVLLLSVEMSEFATLFSAVWGAGLAVFNRFLFASHGLPLHLFFFKEPLNQEMRQSPKHIIGAIAGGMVMTLSAAYGISAFAQMIGFGF